MFGRLKKLKKMNTDESGAVDISGLVGAIIVIVVGVLLLPLIQAQVTNLTVPSQANANVTYLTGVSKTLMEQIPLFYVLGLTFIALVWAIHSVKGN